MPRRAGYCLAMNRDEKRARPAGLPPACRNIAGHNVVCPSEPGGGTWIALNDTGGCFALINWYSVTDRVTHDTVSRGGIIPAVCAADNRNIVADEFARLSLDRVNPFRLIGVFPACRQITEWRWNLKKLECVNHPWRLQQWISSGFDEPKAQWVRGTALRRAQGQMSTGSLDWLRRLHRSHSPEAGPFSTCMHREDAATVSYTEISVLRSQARMCHIGTAPCRRA